MAERSECLRRSARIKALPNQQIKNKKEGSCTKHRIRHFSASSTESEQSPDELNRELENDLKNIEENRQKSTELYAEEQDVNGASIYKFPSSLKSGAMAQKASISHTPSTPKTPKHTSKENRTVMTAETGHSYRVRLKKRLEAIGRNSIMNCLSSTENESESESVSEEEYTPSADEKLREDESSESEDSEQEQSSRNLEEDPRIKIIHSPVEKTIGVPTASSSGGNRISCPTYNDYHLKTEEYFESQSEKVVTSDRTLGRLVNPQIDEEILQQLLAKQSYVSEEHKEAIKSLSRAYPFFFPMWYYIIEEGYTLLLHGLGSKRMLINNFRKEILSDRPTLVIDGFFPSLTAKEILDGIIVDLLGLESPSNLNECLNLIEKILRENPEDRLYLLIHNIDGLMLRSSKVQDVLSLLASIPNLAVVASIDHINTPMIWDNVKHSRYNFCWWDITTLMPYNAETSFESSIMVQRRGALALSSLVNVFLSLTPNARKIYILLVKDQLENATSKTYLGMAFKDLYRGAREGFLVSSDLALRAQLTEFIDHKLVRTKRNFDGTEYLHIPLDNALLNQFLEHQDSTE